MNARRPLRVVLAIALSIVAGPSAGTAVAFDEQYFGDLHVEFPAYEFTSTSPSRPKLADVGDANGDGWHDVGVALPSRDANVPSAIWVTYMPSRLPATLSADEPAWQGMRIVGAYPVDIAGLPDVNGDGRDEVALRTDGAVHVVFGRSESATVDVADLGSQGFSIVGFDEPPPRYLYGDPLWPLCCGRPAVHERLLSPGDQNGDGLSDLAFPHRGAVKVVYTPAAPAGVTVDLRSLGDGGHTFTRAGGVGEPRVLDDLDRDGRRDLVMTRNTGGYPNVMSHTVAATQARPGETVDIDEVVDKGTGFEITGPGTVEWAVPIGDRNGDGRRDLVFARSGGDYCGWAGPIAYSPPLGTRRTLCPLVPGTGEQAPYVDTLLDIGDQDEDGIGDYIDRGFIQFSRADQGWRLGGMHDDGSLGVTMARGWPGAMLSDRNGDGKPEYVTIHREPIEREQAPYRVKWAMEIFLSAPLPRVKSVDPPEFRNGTFTFRGTWATGAGSQSRFAQAWMLAEVLTSKRDLHQRSSPTLDARGPTTGASVDINLDVQGLAQGLTYEWRIGLLDERGQIGWTPWKPLDYQSPRDREEALRSAPPADTPLAAQAVAPDLGRAPVRPARVVLRGTNRRDVMRGGAGNDILRAAAGHDAVSGRAGHDRLYGQSGNDSLTGGPGRDLIDGGPGHDRISARDGETDTIRCGKGRDRVTADKRDRVKGCERVRRARR